VHDSFGERQHVLRPSPDAASGVELIAPPVHSDVGLRFVHGRMKGPQKTVADSELAIRVSKLWPHRKHAASSVLGLLCGIGFHRWRRLNLATLVPDKNILHCFWCPKVQVDGVIYDV
jgi:hypothetical protein